MNRPESSNKFLGKSVERVEDASLLLGRGRYIDDLPIRKDTAYLAILRSPHGHAQLISIDVSSALALEGVHTVITGEEIANYTRSLTVGVKANVECWPIARDRVRYVGEPVALVVADTRYIAEDALELIAVEYEILPSIIDPEAALLPDAVILHPTLGTNLINERKFRYGDPEAAFERAEHRVSIRIAYPRNSCTPIETYGVIAEYNPGDDAYDITANFQGPFSIHAVISRALNTPSNRVRLRTPPDSGGSFGVKQGVFPYIILAAVAARIAQKPVKWIEDRLEHLTASVSATNRVTTLAAAVTAQGKILALDWDQLEDCGAHLRAPEPATLYRMHGNMTGAYDIQNVCIRNRVVLTNKTPTGLNRGFGGPQVYFALERLVHRIADELGLDRLDVIRTNLIQAHAFPYRTATGNLYDSGDYQAALELAVKDGGLSALYEKRDRLRSEGRIYGIGLTAAVEPSVSNMGYITTVLTPQERTKAGPKNGSQAVATLSIDPLGAVIIKVASVPQGQGHRTVLAQVVADKLSLPFASIRVNTELDTNRDAWSIASGNYASRFAPAVAGAVALAADKVRHKLIAIAAHMLSETPEAIRLEDGAFIHKDDPNRRISFARVAAASHWAPGTLPDSVDQTIQETVFWTPPELVAPTQEDGINSSLCHGFIFDFCGIEIDQNTGSIHIDKYVTMHDCGTILHPGMVDGQVRGAFAQAVGASLFEEYTYGSDGSFQAGTLADYLIPTVMEVPDLHIMHFETPSPFTPLGAKGVGEGNCMSTPVCIANAIADALNIRDVTLPVTPSVLAEYIFEEEKPSSKPAGQVEAVSGNASDRKLTGEGSAMVAMPRDKVWDLLLDPKTLQAVIPGAHDVRKISDTHYRAEVTLGVGPVKGRYKADIKLSDMQKPEKVTLSGGTEGALGSGKGLGRITLTEADGGTRIDYTYEAAVGGKVASVGGRLLDGAARVVIGQFFQSLARFIGGPGQQKTGFIARIIRFFRRQS